MPRFCYDIPCRSSAVAEAVRDLLTRETPAPPSPDWTRVTTARVRAEPPTVRVATVANDDDTAEARLRTCLRSSWIREVPLLPLIRVPEPIPTQFARFAHQQASHDGGAPYFTHFATEPRGCQLYDRLAPIWHVTMRPVEGDEDSPYWGFYEYEDLAFDRPARLSLIYASRTLLEICFAYGLETERQRGRGIPVNLVITDARRIEGDLSADR